MMPEAARSFWFGIAKLNAGDANGARSSLREAARLAADDPRAQQVAEGHLARVDEPGQMGPHSVSVEVAELADRLSTIAGQLSKGNSASPVREAGKALPRVSRVPLKVMPATALLSLVTVAISVVTYLIFGNIADLGILIASGANIKSATVNGEWWRLGSSVFLHLGVAHLALNVYGLWVLGRLVEQMQGSLRTLVIYLLSGLAGSLASTYLGASATSLGASASVLGLMGAALAEFAIHREDYPKRWVRTLLGSLLVLTVAQLSIGFFYPTVDHWGLAGGLVSGAVFGAILSPRIQFAASARRVLGALGATAAVVFFAYAAFMAVTSNYTQTLRSYKRAPQVVGGLQMRVPGSWEKISERQLHDPGIGALLDFRRVSAEEGLDATISARLESEHFGGALRAGFDRAKPSARSRLKLPAPWRGGELDVSVDASAGPQRYRLVVFGRVVDDEVWLGAYYHPAALTEYIQPVFGEVLATVRAAGKGPKQKSP